jgi:hypothetical protein
MHCYLFTIKDKFSLLLKKFLVRKANKAEKQMFKNTVTVLCSYATFNDLYTNLS